MSGGRPEGFNELLHFPVRLSIVSLLAPAVHVEFSFLREATGLSDSALSKQLTSLQEAGYVEVRRTGRRATAALTAEGRRALAEHAAALRALLGAAFDGAPPETPAGEALRP
ncbi:transcriptional regulator [Actinoplanes flavus]|uniref:Transcriptional regulator n=1 Tax=Actinoplanes flavus TaxID=2820290 RepID=A0ABS3UDN1_9ACTN|nr:transcriptional regulator [Actinoplanes flavus]MBO3736888.1 transcriptional regulator [Actinoplanes flavus]